MAEVVLHAIGVDEVRELFSGSPDAVARLRLLAAAAFPTTRPPSVGLLSKLGPLLRRPPDAPVVHPGVPTGRDLDDLAHGRDLPPERLSAGWALVRLWLDDRAFGRLGLTLTEPALDDLDFALGAAGVDARLGFRKLFNDQLAIPLKPLPGQASGYVRSAHAAAMADAWRAVADDLPGDSVTTARLVADWLAGLPLWSTEARDAGRPAPDLVATWQE